MTRFLKRLIVADVSDCLSEVCCGSCQVGCAAGAVTMQGQGKGQGQAREQAKAVQAMCVSDECVAGPEAEECLLKAIRLRDGVVRVLLSVLWLELSSRARTVARFVCRGFGSTA